MKAFNRRSRRNRKPNHQQNEADFFSNQNVQTKEETFFQPKLHIGEQGDPYEREADAVARNVVEGNTATRGIMAHPPALITQRKPGDEQKEHAATDTPKEEEQKVQAKEEDEDKIQRQTEAKEEEPVQKKEEEEKEEKPAVMTKRELPLENTSALPEQLKREKGRGDLLPANILRNMRQKIGADFRDVRIHTGEEAAEMNRALGAKAFTHGNDIYFNAGKYETDTTAGKELLAHELTHTVQQQAVSLHGKPPTKSAAVTSVQKQASTPLPKGVQPDKKTKKATFTDSGFVIIILPDSKAKKGSKEIPPNEALTSGIIEAKASYKTEAGKIVSVNVTKTLTIQTIYGTDAKGSDTAAYGRGTTEEDKKNKTTSLRFHEGIHGLDCMNYITTHPFPEFVINEPLTQSEYDIKFAEWQKAVRTYQDNMNADSVKKTDMVGTPMK